VQSGSYSPLFRWQQRFFTVLGGRWGGVGGGRRACGGLICTRTLPGSSGSRIRRICSAISCLVGARRELALHGRGELRDVPIGTSRAPAERSSAGTPRRPSSPPQRRVKSADGPARPVETAGHYKPRQAVGLGGLWRSGGSASGARPGTGLPHPGSWLVAGCVCVLSRPRAMTVGFMSSSLAEGSSMSTTIPTSTAGSMGSSTSSPSTTVASQQETSPSRSGSVHRGSSSGARDDLMKGEWMPLALDHAPA
jgi:hypothetical protein